MNAEFVSSYLRRYVEIHMFGGQVIRGQVVRVLPEEGVAEVSTGELSTFVTLEGITSLQPLSTG